MGTGFYVEKSTGDAVKFYTGKVEELNKNLAEIEKAVVQKSDSLRLVEEVLRAKVVMEQQQQQQPPPQGAPAPPGREGGRSGREKNGNG